MRKAIETKYFGPGNVRGSRIQAKANGVPPIYYERHFSNMDREHANAAKFLAEKYNWSGLWVAGGKADGKGNVYVCLPFSAEWIDDYAQSVADGPEGEDWFYIAAREPGA
jgi:hypothetical protein